MKKVTIFALLLTGLLGCTALGIGKQCYQCTTEALGRPNYPRSVTEVCGSEEASRFAKENSKVIGGVIIQTSCREK